MSHTFFEFRDFEYMNEFASVSEKVVITVYVKVLDKNQKYLGSLKFGLYKNYESKDLKDFINDVIFQNYPDFKTYQSQIIKL